MQQHMACRHMSGCVGCAGCVHVWLVMHMLAHHAYSEDFLGILLVRWLFRRSGAFFIRRSFAGTDACHVMA